MQTVMYKLVTQDMKTQNNTHWEIGVTNKAKLPGTNMCSGQVLHCYSNPYLAVLFNPIHANIANPILMEIKCSPIVNTDGLKHACKEQTPIRVIPLPTLTTTQKVAFAIKCALLVCKTPLFITWAEKWLSGEDRSYAAAHYAADAADAAAAHYAADAAAARYARYAAASYARYADAAAHYADADADADAAAAVRYAADAAAARYAAAHYAAAAARYAADAAAARYAAAAARYAARTEISKSFITIINWVVSNIS